MKPPPTSSFPLPDNWPKRVRSAILAVTGMAHTAGIVAHAWAESSPLPRVRLAGELALAQTDLARQAEIIRILTARLATIPPHRRPDYSPSDRLAILQLKAACGWNQVKIARVFLIEPETIATWLKRLNDAGPRALLQLAEPVNKFPEFVALCVRQFKATCPLFGKKRIAQVLARAGLSISSSTVSRLLKRKTGQTDPTPTRASKENTPASSKRRVVTARYPHHVWHTDLTLVPCISGFWIPWLPFALPQGWPFAVWVAVALDHYSRSLVGFAVFLKQPTSTEVQAFLSRASRQAGRAPKYIISDRGTQFECATFRDWCKGRNIKTRYGAVGRYGSIAIIERFIRTLKSECIRHLIAWTTIANSEPNHLYSNPLHWSDPVSQRLLRSLFSCVIL